MSAMAPHALSVPYLSIPHTNGLAAMTMSLKDVQQKFVAKCEAKCQGGITVARQLRKM